MKKFLKPGKKNPLQAHQMYMERAIQVAKEAEKAGGVAIGAVLVNDVSGRVVAEGGSLVGVTKDPTAHAEVNCIRKLSQKLKTDDLYGHTLYSTLEPCHMCLSCAAWAKIACIYFGAYRKDVDPNLFDTNHAWGDEKEARFMNLREKRRMYVHGGILERQCAGLLHGYRDRPRHPVHHRSTQPAHSARAAV